MKLENLTKWQNYAHYFLLVLWIFFIHYLSDIWGIEALVVEGVWYGWIALYLFYVLGAFIGDTLIHMFFSALPEPYKWAD